MPLGDAYLASVRVSEHTIEAADIITAALKNDRRVERFKLKIQQLEGR